jgi:hypothetical protein
VTAPAQTEPIEVFLDRHVFVLFRDGGIAVDLLSGTYSSLNATAAATCELIQKSRSWTEVLVAAAARWDLTEQEASAALDTLRGALSGAQRTPVFHDDFPYRPLGSHYALFHQGRPILEVTSDGHHVRLASPLAAVPASVEHCLRLVSPKILARLGRHLLHGAACQVGPALIGFCGPSGAGKTTTTNLLAGAGARKVADDLLLVSIRDGLPFAHHEAEQRIYRWCSEAASTLTRRPDESVSCAGLQDAAAGPEVPLGKLIFLDQGNRTGQSFETRRVPEARAIEQIVSCTFLGGVDPEALRRFFGQCGELARCLPCELAHVPADLGALADALQAYKVKTAS